MREVMLFFVLILLASSVNAESIFLSDYMEEGQTKVYETEDGVYVVNLLSVSDSGIKAVFRLNDEMSKGIKLKDSYVFDDGSEIVLRDLVINDAGNGNDEAYYYFYGTGDGVLDLKNVSKYVLDNNLCNFDGQCLDEDKENCCYDCGCSDRGECVNNKCIETEDERKAAEEEGNKEVKEDVKEEKVEEELDIKRAGSEKKAAYAMLAIILIFVVVIAWFVMKKKKRIF